jgi:hypothetical protein
MMLTTWVKQASQHMNRQVDIAPLAVLRILFGVMMLLGTLRFMTYGWVNELYVLPKYHFNYFGFEWVKPIGETGMYVVFSAMALASAFIALGFLFRVSALVFFLLFTYVELIDVTNYLNHYYFISLCSFLLLLSPAGKTFSIDGRLFPNHNLSTVPFWSIGMFRLQLGILYVFAGIAKLNYDWLILAQPLSIWFVSFREVPLVGWLFQLKETAYVFSWAGALYDLTIPFFLLWAPTRIWAYITVVGFHFITWLMFPIGMFPWVMMVFTWVFFPIAFHRKLVNAISARFLSVRNKVRAQRLSDEYSLKTSVSASLHPFILSLLVVFFAVQLFLPLRHFLYPENLFWTEQGYRFSWRVMLMEKNGFAQFKVRDPETGKQWEIHNAHYLTPQQEKMMSTQPDLLLQFAHILDNEFQSIGIANPIVTADVQVSLNGRRSRPFVNPNVDLSSIKDSWRPKTWILPYSSEL